ncbi:hypothetical protein [Paraburkholderia sp. SIMBA_030]|uniref:hypothetical protein n=1 Tax=Paraburkholderia sp. SIMBA_030 TaxID=3085773 RepID=UPI00397B3F75
MKRKLPPEVTLFSLSIALDALEEVVPRLACSTSLAGSGLSGLDRCLVRVNAILDSSAARPRGRSAHSRVRRKTPPASLSGTLFPDLM